MSVCWLCVKPPSMYFHFQAKFRNLFNHAAQTLTIFRLRSQLLHGLHVVNCDATGDVWPACRFVIQNDDALQTWRVTQYVLKGQDGCGRGESIWIQTGLRTFWNSQGHTQHSLLYLWRCTFRRLWSRSLLVITCVTSASFRPWVMAVVPRVAYRVTTVQLKCRYQESSSFFKMNQSNACFCSPLTGETVHETGLCRHHPLCFGLAEDGDVALRLLAESCQTTAKTLCCTVDLPIRSPAVAS